MEKEAGGKSFVVRLVSSRAMRWGVGIPVALLLGISCASLILDKPLRSYMEKKMNSDLKGYSVRLPGLHLQLLDLSLTLKGLAVLQNAHPATPVVQFPVLTASIQWRSILSGKLVAKLRLEQPKIVINLQQMESEAADKSTLKERGWQRAIEDIYPLKINSVQVVDASVTYIGRPPEKPLVLSHLNLQAANIRNIALPDLIYPSSFHLDTAIFGTGHGSVDGAANFLSEPYPGMKGKVKLENVALESFNPVFSRRHLTIHGGVLQASGEAEFAPKAKSAHLETLAIKGMAMEYIYFPLSVEADKKRLALLAKTVKKISDKPGMSIRADRIRLTQCTLGWTNETPGKKYRLFLADTDLQLSNFSDHFTRGPAQVRLKAKFMGSGLTTASAVFRSDRAGPDFDLHVRVEDSRLPALNDLLRAYGHFDVASGSFSLVSELHVKNRILSGYVKPFFKEVKVYDRKKDKGRGILHRGYEMLVGVAAEMLENRSRHEVATKATIRGTLGKPETSNWQIIGQLVRNAFFKAILPNFEGSALGFGKK